MFPLSASPPEVFCYPSPHCLLFSRLARLRKLRLARVSRPICPLIRSVLQINLLPSRLFVQQCSLITQQRINSLLDFLRKEVIQPHLPIRLPCYDFTPVISPAFGSSLLAVGSLTSGITNSHGVTGGVYKTRERIHRDILIRDY